MNLLHAKKFLSDFRCRNSRLIEAILYVFVGLIGMVIDFCCFFALLNFSVLPLVAQWTAAMAGFLHNHLWHHFFVFKHHQNFTRTTFWSMFFSVLTIAISGPLLILLQKVFDNFIFNKIVVIGLTAVFLFTVRKLFIFKKI